MDCFKLKIDKNIVEQIKALYQPNTKLVAKVLFLLDLFIIVKNNKNEQPYFCYKTLTPSYIKGIINPNHNSFDTFLNNLIGCGIVKKVVNGRNKYNRNNFTHIIDLCEDYCSEYSFYDVDVNDDLYKELTRLKERKNKYSTRLINDDQIVIENTDLILTNELKEIITLRKSGESICSATSKTKFGNGRLNNIYSNIEKETRAKLYDNNTGLQLSEIDLKNSQFRFFLALLKYSNNNKNTELSKEIEYLENQSDIYSHFSIETGLSRIVVKKLMLPMLCGDWRNHGGKKHFKKETCDWFLENNLDIKKSWDDLFGYFEDTFNNITRYTNGMCEVKARTGKASIASELQHEESLFITKILEQLKTMSRTNNIQFFSVFDAIFFSTEHKDLVVDIVESEIRRESRKEYKPALLSYELKIGELIVDLNLLSSSKDSDATLSDFLNGAKQESTNIDKEEEKGEIPFNGTFDSLTPQNLSLTGQNPTLNGAKRNRPSEITTKKDGRYKFKSILSKKNETKEQFKTRLITELGYKETDFKKENDVEEIKIVAKNEQAAGNQEPNDIEVSPTITLAIPDAFEAEEDPFIAMVKRDGFGPTYPPRNFKEDEK